MYVVAPSHHTQIQHLFKYLNKNIIKYNKIRHYIELLLYVYIYTYTHRKYVQHTQKVLLILMFTVPGLHLCPVSTVY